MQRRLTSGLMKGSQFIASQAVNLGQNTFDFIVSLFVMLYLLFFLLRDGDALAGAHQGRRPARGRTAASAPREVHHRHTRDRERQHRRGPGAGSAGRADLLGPRRQPPLLWAALMTVLSLLPAVGAGIVWLPVALYLLATGAILKGIILIAYGVLVIGLVDNVLRPILVGKDTKMPDYVVLVSTLGGIAIFGVNGFVLGPVIAAMFIASWDIFSVSKLRSR